MCLVSIYPRRIIHFELHQLKEHPSSRAFESLEMPCIIRSPTKKAYKGTVHCRSLTPGLARLVTARLLGNSLAEGFAGLPTVEITDNFLQPRACFTSRLISQPHNDHDSLAECRTYTSIEALHCPLPSCLFFPGTRIS